MFGLSRRKNAFDDDALALYGQSLQASREPVFYRDYGVSDTMDGRFELLVVHLFLVIDRLNAEEDQAALAQSLFDVTFASLDQAFRNEGVGDMGVPKRMRKMMLVFNSRMHSYSEAREREALAACLRDTVYGSMDRTKEQAVAALASYMLEQEAHLGAMALQDMIATPKIFKEGLL